MQITLSIHVHAPLDRVFDVFTDVTRAEERLSNVAALEVLTAGPVGLGTRWRETRRMMGQEDIEEMGITAFDPPNAYTVTADSRGARYHTTFRFVPEGEGTAVTMHFEAVAVSLFARLLSLTSIIFRHATETALLSDLEDLKRACEQEP